VRCVVEGRFVARLDAVRPVAQTGATCVTVEKPSLNECTPSRGSASSKPALSIPPENAVHRSPGPRPPTRGRAAHALIRGAARSANNGCRAHRSRPRPGPHRRSRRVVPRARPRRPSKWVFAPPSSRGRPSLPRIGTQPAPTESSAFSSPLESAVARRPPPRRGHPSAAAALSPSGAKRVAHAPRLKNLTGARRGVRTSCLGRKSARVDLYQNSAVRTGPAFGRRRIGASTSVNDTPSLIRLPLFTSSPSKPSGFAPPTHPDAFILFAKNTVFFFFFLLFFPFFVAWRSRPRRGPRPSRSIPGVLKKTNNKKNTIKKKQKKKKNATQKKRTEKTKRLKN